MQVAGKVKSLSPACLLARGRVSPLLSLCSPGTTVSALCPLLSSPVIDLCLSCLSSALCGPRAALAEIALQLPYRGDHDALPAGGDDDFVLHLALALPQTQLNCGAPCAQRYAKLLALEQQLPK